MATSGSYDYLRTAAQIITSALENLGVLAAGGTVATADNTTALSRLNYIAKQIQGQADGSPGLKIHSRQRVFVFLAKGQQQYTIGPAATDARATTLYGRTTVSSAYASGTSLSVAAVTDTTSFPGTTVSMTTGDIIGVQLNDGTISWTTLNGTPGSSPATLTGALAGAAASGNYVWWFTSRAQRLINCEAAVLRYATAQDAQLKVYKVVQEYDLGVTQKDADGTPTSLLFEPLRTNTRIILDRQPAASDITSQLLITGWYPSEDYDATSDDIAYPQEAYRFLSWELTYELHAAYGVDWTPAMEKCRLESRQTYLNLNPEVSDAYFRA